MLATSDRNEAKLARLRVQIARETPGKLIGFQTAGGPAGFWSSDPEAGPHMSPVGSIPYHSDLGQLWSALSLSTEQQSSDAVDVRPWRTIALYIDYTTVNANQQLVLIPQVSPDGGSMYNIAVISASITQVDPPGAAPFLGVYGQRTVYEGAPLITPVALAGGAGQVSFKLAFDIEEDWWFRIRVYDAQSQSTNLSTLAVRYRMCR